MRDVYLSIESEGDVMPMRYFLVNMVPVTVTAAALGWIIGDLVW